MSLRTLCITATLLGASGALLYSFTGTGTGTGTGRAEVQDAAASSAASAPTLADQPLAPGCERLLEVAFEAASAIPPMPHVKTRARLQEAVVVARLELDQPQRAERAIERIDNWRRGVGYADLALYAARKGDEQTARRYIEAATRMTDEMATEAYITAADEGLESAQAWRRDRIRAKVACAQLHIGDVEQAEISAKDLERSEVPPVAAMKAKLAGARAFEEQPAKLQEAAKGSLEDIQAALVAGIEVYQAVYEDVPRREKLEQELEACILRTPPRVRIDLYSRLAECAIDHQDTKKALELVDDARFASEVGEWPMKDRIAVAVQLAEQRYRAGDREKARIALDVALADFDAAIDHISGLDRADVLAPIAAAYETMGDAARARTLYTRAVEEGAQNPNAVPRAEDLVATLTSMALHDIEPDDALWKRIDAIRGELRDPW